jgi:Rieske Fe-S protein
MKKNEMDRREFIEKTGVLVVCSLAFGELMLSCSKKAKDNLTQPSAENTYAIDLNNANNAVLKNAGGSLKFNVPGQSKPVIVIRKSATEVIALSSVCTHQGNEVDLPSGNTITCPVHGSVFDLSGSRVSGPAPAGSKLTEIPSKLEATQIVLTLV